ncbi:MAG: hypothetical protein EAZ30_01305 [Betaproteobacteria bacterium]|nr:MAG: hypothetical protein EAZ30_01305 [Betaproteobacteria bacterium]
MRSIQRSRRFIKALAATGAIGVATLSASSFAVTYYLSPTGTDAGTCTLALPCATVMYAHGLAASGDVVNLAAGTYTQELDITKSITLSGAGATSSIIQAPATLTDRVGIIPSGNATTTDRNAVVLVRGGATVIMQNLQVLGPGSTNCASLGFGVFVGGGANLTFTNGRIVDVRDGVLPLSGCQNGTGIRYGASSTSQVATGVVANSTIVGFQKNGITADGVGTNVQMTGNTIIGQSPPPIIAQNAIQVSRGATATVTGNTISDSQCGNPTNCGPGFDKAWSTAILLFEPGATTITGNTLGSSDVGILLSGTATTPAITVSNNTLINNRVGVSAQTGTLNLTGNTITGGQRGAISAAFIGDVANSVINLNGGNIISGSSIAGVSVYDEDLADAITATVQGAGNQFINNAVAASNVPAQGIVNLGCNWWGSALGPVNPANPLGAGNPATPNTTFSNWSIDNTSFACTGNAQNNEVLNARVVPTLSAPAMASLMAMLGFAVYFARRRQTIKARAICR